MHVLYEHASGYALFRVKEFEELGLLEPAVEESVHDLSRFNSVVKLVAFAPFRSGTNALDNMNSISEGNFLALFGLTPQCIWIALRIIVHVLSFPIPSRLNL